MSKSNGAINRARPTPEATARIAARQAGLALHNASYASAARDFFRLACLLACSADPEIDSILDEWEDDLRNWRRRRRDGLWRAMRDERWARRQMIPAIGDAEPWERAA